MTNSKCPVCGETFADVTRMRQHFNDKHRANVVTTDQVTPDSTIDGSIPEQRCENCRHWGKGNNITICRAHPWPGSIMQNPNTGQLMPMSVYTPALANEWCGEWKSNGRPGEAPNSLS